MAALPLEVRGVALSLLEAVVEEGQEEWGLRRELTSWTQRIVGGAAGFTPPLGKANRGLQGMRCLSESRRALRRWGRVG